MTAIFYFLFWTFILYWIHRLVNNIPVLRNFHRDHHDIVRSMDLKWRWNNLLLYNDTPKSTIDLWITEVIPTIIFSTITGQWWILIFFYLWTALLQEGIEHNKNFDVPFLTSGRWHLVHHKYEQYNYGLFFPIWDIIFMTNKGYKCQD